MSPETDQERYDKAEDLAAKYRRNLTILCAAGLFLMIACFTALAFGLKAVNDLAKKNHVVTCNLRDGYQEQYDSTVKFLKANPNGGELLGVKFTRDDLLRQKAGLKKRLDDTKDAGC